jgi:hypothetical protein
MDVADGAHVVSYLVVVAEAEAMANRPVVVVVVAVVAVVDAVAAMVRLLKPSQRPAVALLTNPLNSACHGLLPRYVFFYRVISGRSAFSLFPSTITGPISWITNATNFLHGESLFDLFVWLCQSLMDHVLLFF